MRDVLTALLVVSLGQLAWATGPQQNGLQAYKDGNDQLALGLLRQEAIENPKNPLILAALLSSLVYEGKADEASDMYEAAAERFPNDPDVMAARGEFVYYMGDMRQAEKLWHAANGVKGENARACYGLYRLLFASSMYRTARLVLMRAHELDAEDAIITRAWIPYLIREKRNEVEGAFREAHPWLYEHFEEAQGTETDVRQELKDRKTFELEGGAQETTLKLQPMLYGPTRLRELALEFSIEGGRHLRMLFDTGGSGILINQRAVDKIGLRHLGSRQIEGLGDAGKRNGFMSVADTCQIGTLKYRTCVLQVVEGKSPTGDEDGLIGADFFSRYLVTIDFRRSELHLAPLPLRTPNPQGYDRALLPEEKGYTPVFRYAHHLYVPTRVNGKTTGLFLIDTGSSMSLIDQTFARLSTKVYGDSYRHIRGISGSIKNVFEASHVQLVFANFQQENIGLSAVDLNNSGDHRDVRMSGIMGFPLLSLFRLTLDYRNGVVKFDYANK